MTVERICITDEEQWLALRRQDVTASDIAVVCGCSPFKTAMQLWAEKAGELGKPEDNIAMRRGRLLESVVIQLCREDTDWHSIIPFENKLYLRDPKRRIGATPDAIATDADGEFIVQCKVVSVAAFQRWEDNKPPLYYQLQTLTEAMLWGAPCAVLAALIWDNNTFELQTFKVPRHAGAEAVIKKRVATFWQEIEAGKSPSADYSRDGEVIRKLFPPKDGIEPVDFSRDNYMTALLDERTGLKSAAKHAEDRCTEIDAEIIHKLDGATKAICDGWRITHSMTHRKEYTVPEKSYPVLRINSTKETKYD